MARIAPWWPHSGGDTSRARQVRPAGSVFSIRTRVARPALVHAVHTHECRHAGRHATVVSPAMRTRQERPASPPAPRFRTVPCHCAVQAGESPVGILLRSRFCKTRGEQGPEGDSDLTRIPRQNAGIRGTEPRGPEPAQCLVPLSDTAGNGGPETGHTGALGPGHGGPGGCGVASPPLSSRFLTRGHLFPILGAQLSGTKCVRVVAWSSPPSVSRTFSSSQADTVPAPQPWLHERDSSGDLV